MKQRITYLLPEGSTLTPDDILLSENGVNVSTAEPPAIEKRVTAGLSELPTELRNVFHDIHELHIRYASRMNCEGSSPLVSRLPPGLHVFFTPRRSDSEYVETPPFNRIKPLTPDQGQHLPHPPHHLLSILEMPLHFHVFQHPTHPLRTLRPHFLSTVLPPPPQASALPRLARPDLLPWSVPWTVSERSGESELCELHRH
ncbi:protease B nonderepressible form [Friedmanniomyces endolithicus]|uniref:Protease B nonderepressible form n=1 Tax=Friedmanniomyces endolithicus TaxID=329885 RepID=A0AAN6KQ80_9PEZI|nr:protease B nonderepressible form [Friedmanniomyces endolithicus]